MTLGLKSKLDVVRAHVATLTPREREVFELVIRGDTNKQIARALGCSERTIKAHRQKVMEKMQVHTLAELVSAAERAGVFASAGEGGRADPLFDDRSLCMVLAEQIPLDSLIEPLKKAPAGRS